MNTNHDILGFIKSNRDILDLITDLVPTPVFVKDRDGMYIDCNKAFTEFLSVGREEIIGKSVYDMWKKEEADIFFAQDNELFEKGGLQIYESKITSSTGEIHIVQFHKQVFSDSAGNVVGFLGVIFDITEKKELERALARLATIDELTGLPNRRDGMIRLNIIQRESARENRSFCIAIIDVDHFKDINDLYGHNNGDLVLKEFSKLVKEILRHDDTCFRYGGDEFIILLPETTKASGLDVAERLRKAWGSIQLFLSDGQSIKSTLSIGLVEYSSNQISIEKLIKESDKALYNAKKSGRNRTVCLQ